LKAVYFRSPAEFRRWLAAHHAGERELLVGFYRKSSGKAGITYKEAVDEALCFGWIDGVKQKVDELRYTHRFTPRRPGSVWSVVNTKRVAELIALKRMAKRGLEVFNGRDPKKTRLYSFENRPTAFDPVLERAFRANAAAWVFFGAQPPGYRRLMTFYVMSAKQPGTRARRLAVLVKSSAEGKRIR
jgi:uncharacterized protein YdeI (YjbR/CyaY-like superfamily)